MANTIKNIRIAILVANGSEDIELVVPLDIWRRAGLIVELVSVEKKNTIVLQNSLKIYCNETLELTNLDQFNAIFLPGGCGIEKFKEHKFCEKLLKTLIKFSTLKQKWIFTICSSPSILGYLNIVGDKKLTCYPGFEELFKKNYVKDEIVVSGNFISAKSLSFAIPFALTVVEQLVDKKTADEVAKKICYSKDYKVKILDK